MDLVRELVTLVIVHHSGVDVGSRSEDQYLSDLDASVRRLRGMDGIPYHRLILPSGRVHIAREWEVRGQHATGHNADAVGLAYAGDLDTHPPTMQARASMVDEAAQALIYFGISLDGLKGHRDLPGVTKSCPGAHVWLWQLRRLVERRLAELVA